MTGKHLATFVWGAGAQTVCVAGGFNEWSATATPLHKQPDGSFSAEIPLPYGEKQAFKYVVDGEWKVREDEAKEWDAAGNMNNIYTAPAAPATDGADATSTSTSSPTTTKSSAPAAAAAGAAGAAGVGAAAVGAGAASHTSESATTVPPSTTADKAPASTSGDASSKTEPSTLIAASAPGTATGATSAPVLGVPVTGGSKATTGVPATGSATTTAAPASGSAPTASTSTTSDSTSAPTPTSKAASSAGPAAGVGAAAGAATGAAVGGLSKDKAAAEKAVTEENKQQPDVTKAGAEKSSLSPGPVLTAVPAKDVEKAAPAESKTSTTAPTGAAGADGTGAAAGAAGVGAASATGPKAATTGATPTAPLSAADGAALTSVPAEATPAQIEKVAATANVGEAPTGEESHGLAEKAAEYGAAAMATLGVVVGGAAAAVEKATGVDLTHSSPLSVEEAKAKGINVAALDKVDGPSDATEPTGTAPPASAVAALDEKIQELKPGSSKDASGVAAVPLPNGQAPKTSFPPADSDLKLDRKVEEPKRENSIPSQPETAPNHTTIPQPVFTTLTEKDPKKDRTLSSTDLKDTAGTKPIDSAPGVDAKEAKREAENDPAGASGAAKGAVGEKAVAPDTPANNLVDAKPKPVPATPSTPGKTATPAAASGAAAGTGAAATEPSSTATPAKAAEAPSTPAKSSAAGPATPAKTNGAATASSTPASTPAKSAHGKEGTSASSVKKRKSSIFQKIKHAFSPKDKSK
ncbi:hypothetical protein IAT38_007676 [Cryptococcus sp. DSM 104549]